MKVRERVHPRAHFRALLRNDGETRPGEVPRASPNGQFDGNFVSPGTLRFSERPAATTTTTTAIDFAEYSLHRRGDDDGDENNVVGLRLSSFSGHQRATPLPSGWRILIGSHDRSVKARHRDNVTSISANKARPRIIRATIGIPWLKTSSRREIIRYRGQIDCRRYGSPFRALRPRHRLLVRQFYSSDIRPLVPGSR